MKLTIQTSRLAPLQRQCLCHDRPSSPVCRLLSGSEPISTRPVTGSEFASHSHTNLPFPKCMGSQRVVTGDYVGHLWGIKNTFDKLALLRWVFWSCPRPLPCLNRAFLWMGGKIMWDNSRHASHVVTVVYTRLDLKETMMHFYTFML